MNRHVAFPSISIQRHRIEIYKTRIRMGVAAYSALACAGLVAVAFRNQTFLPGLEWYWTTIAASVTFVVCFRLADMMFHKGKY
jgi:hypothetical protein